MLQRSACILLVLLLASAASSMAQNRTSIGVYGSLSGGDIFIIGADDNAQVIAESFKEKISPDFGFEFGVAAERSLGAHFTIQSGFSFRRHAYQYMVGGAIEPIFPPGPSGWEWMPYDYNLALETRQEFDYLSVPLRVLWSPGSSNLRFVAGLGVSADYLINARSTIITNDEWFGPEPRVNSNLSSWERFNLSAMLSAGVSYQLNESLLLRAEPFVSYGLMDVVTFKGYQARLGSVGLMATAVFML